MFIIDFSKKKMREPNVRLDTNIKYHKHALFHIREMFSRFAGAPWLRLVVKINDQVPRGICLLFSR